MSAEAQHSAHRHAGDLFLEALVERLAERLEDAVREALETAAPGRPPAQAGPPDAVCGLDPNRLYSVSFLSERWDLDPDTVRRIPAAELPRAPWRGAEIRYRGRDVLRYEGVDEAVLGPDTIHTLPEAAPPRRKAAAPTTESRVYRRDLPAI